MTESTLILYQGRRETRRSLSSSPMSLKRTRKRCLASGFATVLDLIRLQMLFTDKKPTLNYAAFRLISKVLERECPGPEQVEEGEKD
jgi:hypothetical protein